MGRALRLSKQACGSKSSGRVRMGGMGVGVRAGGVGCVRGWGGGVGRQGGGGGRAMSPSKRACGSVWGRIWVGEG